MSRANRENVIGTNGNTETEKTKRGRKPKSSTIPTAGDGAAAAAGTGSDRNTNSTSTTRTTDSGNQETVLDGQVSQLVIEKPKREKKSDKKFDKELESNIRLLVQTGFGLTSNILGKIWQVSEEESTAISVPLTKILMRMNMSEHLNKYADYIALGVGLSIVVAPRVIMQKKMIQDRGLKTNERKIKKTKNNDSDSKNSGSENKTTTSIADTTNIKSLFGEGL